MQHLRNRAYLFGYTIYYPGIYAKKAIIYSQVEPNVKSHEVNMTDRVKGFNEISSILDKIEQSREII